MTPDETQNIHFSQERDFWGNLKRDLQELRGISTLVYELIQNADDVKTLDGQPGGARSITFDIREDSLIVENDGQFSNCGKLEKFECPWKESRGHRCDFHRMKQVGGGDKVNQTENTGAFGIGFNAVYQMTDHPEIISNGWHWHLHPENERDQRIVATKRNDTIGTRFVLPWAFDPNSKVRQELKGCPAVKKDQIDNFRQEIQTALPKAIIFLKQITSLGLMVNGQIVCQIERKALGQKVEIWVNSEKTTWHVFQGDFAQEAANLRMQHLGAIEPTRRSNIAIAIPDSLLVKGYLFADLPTETPTNLPFHIESNFYPTSDRKRIFLDDSISSQWNRQAIKSAAILLTDSFNEIEKIFPATQLWDWIAQIHKGSKESPLDRSFESFWDQISKILPNKPILLTSNNDKTFIESARLLESDEEISASKVWEALGIPVVHPDLRKHYTLLQLLGTPRLGLVDITDGLSNIDLKGRLSFKQVHPALGTIARVQVMWKAINSIATSRNRSSADEREKAFTELPNYSIAVGMDGCLYPPSVLYRGDSFSRKTFPEIIWLKDLPDSDPIPNKLVREFSVTQAVSYLTKLSSGKLTAQINDNKFSLITFYQWLEIHRDEVILDRALQIQLKNLPIWPAGKSLLPISELYLPGGFDDPLGLASVINITALGGKSEYLRDVLGVKSLDFLTYIREQIPQAFNTNGIPSALVKQFVNLLAVRLGQFRDYVDIRYILQKLQLIECKDGEFHPALQTYFDNEVNRVLGDGLNLAVQLKENSSAIDQLYEWLGVARRPRDEDVLARINMLITQPPDPASRQAIETLFTYLGQRWKAVAQNDSPERHLFEQKFNILKRLRWLPANRNPEQWFSPDTIFTIFNDYWFKSQGNFLAFPDPVQRESSKFLEDFLIVNSQPLTIHVVRHILHCSENSIAVNWDVYRFLSFKERLAEKEVIRELEGKACLLVSEDPVKYVRPDQVFWNDHPFGSYRYKLGPKLRAYEELLNCIGVRTDPQIADYIQVLLDISNQVRNSSLDDETYDVVMYCWQRLSDALAAGQITPDDLKAKLSKQKIIPNPLRGLTAPDLLFFEDRAGLAARFVALLKNNVIQRTEGCWLAMEAVGVQLLSRIVEVDLSKEIDSLPDAALLTLIQQRKLLIQRIIDAEQTAGSELASRDKLLSLDYQRATELEIVMSIHVFNRRYQTEPEETRAVLKENTFYSVWPENAPSWAAIGRELALALKPSGEIGSLAMGIKEVLSAPSYASASASLDELNYPPLQASEQPEIIEPSIFDLPKDVDPLEAILGGKPPETAPTPILPSEDPKLSGGKGKGGNTKPRRRASRIITYVYPDDDLLPPRDGSETTTLKRTASEQAGVVRVIEDEAKFHRDALDKNKEIHNHPGYDLESTDRETGVIRYIEVKALSGIWDSSNPVLVTHTEFETAKIKGDEYWLYIVELATSADFQIYRIQNPANRVNYFVFDHGWEPLANK